MQRSGSGWTGRTSGHHGLWWDARPCVPGWHGRACVAVVLFRFFPRVAVDLLHVFAGFHLYNEHVPGHSNTPNTLHSHPLSFPRVLERERGSGEGLLGFHTGFDREI